MRRLKAGGAVQASVVFDADRRAFVADMSGQLQAFSSDGGRLWQQPVVGAISATPAVDAGHDRLFVGTHGGWVCAFNRRDGVLLWQRRLPTATDPRIVADLLVAPNPERVVMSSWGGQFHALDPATGETIGSWDAGISPRAAASADAEGNLYFLRAVWDKGVCLVRCRPDGTETELYRHPEGERRANRMVAAAAPVIDQSRGVLYFITNGDRSSRVHAWSLASDTHRWDVAFEHTIVATPALRADGVLVVADMAGSLVGILPDGTVLFRYLTGCEYLLGGPVCDGESMSYLGDPIGLVHRVDAAGAGKSFFEVGRSLQARPSWNPDGDFFMPSTDRQVYVFRNEATG